MKLPCRKGAITLASATRLLEQQATVSRFASAAKPTGGPGRSDLPALFVRPAPSQEPARLAGVEFY